MVNRTTPLGTILQSSKKARVLLSKIPRAKMDHLWTQKVKTKSIERLKKENIPSCIDESIVRFVGKQPYICPECGTKFRPSRNLQEHFVYRCRLEIFLFSSSVLLSRFSKIVVIIHILDFGRIRSWFFERSRLEQIHKSRQRVLLPRPQKKE